MILFSRWYFINSPACSCCVHTAVVMPGEHLGTKNLSPSTLTVSNVFGKLETDGISKDLAAIVTTAEEVQHTASWLKVVFACHDQHIWQSFVLPAFAPISCLEIGRHFHPSPLLQTIESNRHYYVVMVENGKASGFWVQGPLIEEALGRFKTEVIRADGRRFTRGMVVSHQKTIVRSTLAPI
jgi:hypothetical protein